MELSHGGDWAGFQEKYGHMPLDFSASTSPLPLPDGIREAVVRSLVRADRYPDPLCRELTLALVEKHKCSPTQILCGAGAADLLFRLILAKRPRRVLVVEPTFSGYKEALRTVDSQVEQVFLREKDDFALTADLLRQIQPGVDMLFLCNPNNPTGRTADRALLRDLLERCAACGTRLVLDECFNDFLDRPEEHSLVGELVQYPNLLILRSFTKWFPLAGLRLGYVLCADEPLLEQMCRRGQPWPVSTPAQAAGRAALREITYSAALADLIQKQRPCLSEGLRALGCRVIPGEANFLLFFCPDAELGQKLEKWGILLRKCSNFPGLGPGWYRTAVRTEEENQTLLQAVREVL